MTANINGTMNGATGAAVQTAGTTAAIGETTGEIRRISRNENSGTITGNEETGQKAISRLENALNDLSGLTVTRTFILKTVVVVPDAPHRTKAEASSLKSSIKYYRTLSHWNLNSKNLQSRSAHNTRFPLPG